MSSSQRHRHLRELNALNNMGQVVTASLDLSQVLQRVLDEVSLLLGSDGVAILLPQGDRLVFAAISGSGAQGLQGYEMPADEGVAGEVMQTGESVWVQGEDGRRLLYQEAEAASGYRTESLLAVPLSVGEEVIGVLEAAHRDDAAFSAEDLQTLQAAANWAAIAIKNAQLYEQGQLELAERQRAEAALRESEARYRAIVEDQMELVCRFLADGTLTFVNQAYGRYFGQAREALLGQSWLASVPADERTAVRQALDSLSPINPVTLVEQRIAARADQLRWQQWTIRAVYSDDGRFREFQSVGRDITERVEAEEARRRYAADLAARNEELDAFSHTVAHDLKNPLSTIIGFAEVLSQEGHLIPEAELHEYLQIIYHSGHKAISIIKELLLLASVRKEEVSLTPLDMTKIVADARTQVAGLVNQYKAEIALPEGWPVALGYAPWIEEVWANYLSNAIKYGGRPPQLHLGATATDNGMVRFWVRDNGEGIPPEMQRALFAPFSRLSQLRVKGHGLGLSIVQRILEKLDGDVGCQSELGQGSLFYFDLPAAPGDA